MPNSYYNPNVEKESWDLGEKEHSEFKSRMFKQLAETISKMDAVLTLNFINKFCIKFKGGNITHQDLQMELI